MFYKMQQNLNHSLHSRKTAALLHNGLKRYWGYLTTERHIGITHFSFCIPSRLTFYPSFSIWTVFRVNENAPRERKHKEDTCSCFFCRAIASTVNNKNTSLFQLSFLFNQPWVCILYARFFFSTCCN